MNVTVHLVSGTGLAHPAGCSKSSEFTDILKCANDEKHWKKRGLHSWTYNQDILLVGHERLLSQPLDHEDDRQLFSDPRHIRAENYHLHFGAGVCSSSRAITLNIAQEADCSWTPETKNNILAIVFKCFFA